jgi:hypothetical protein
MRCGTVVCSDAPITSIQTYVAKIRNCKVQVWLIRSKQVDYVKPNIPKWHRPIELLQYEYGAKKHISMRYGTIVYGNVLINSRPTSLANISNCKVQVCQLRSNEVDYIKLTVSKWLRPIKRLSYKYGAEKHISMQYGAIVCGYVIIHSIQTCLGNISNCKVQVCMLRSNKVGYIKLHITKWLGHWKDVIQIKHGAQIHKSIRYCTIECSEIPINSRQTCLSKVSNCKVQVWQTRSTQVDYVKLNIPHQCHRPIVQLGYEYGAKKHK